MKMRLALFVAFLAAALLSVAIALRWKDASPSPAATRPLSDDSAPKTAPGHSRAVELGVRSADPKRVPTGLPDPVLAQCRKAVLGRDARMLMETEVRIRASEGSYLSKLKKVATSDKEPRMRAYSIAALSRFRQPPPESFFAARLRDPHEFPRTSAVDVIRRLGTAASLGELDRLAAKDPSERVRQSAVTAAAELRSR